MDPLIKKVEDCLRKEKFISYGDSILVGVSGGPDSVGLLHVLKHLQNNFGFKLFVAHFNHNIRRGAKRDQMFVKKLSQELQLPFFTATRRKAKGQSVNEEALREARLNFLMHVAKKKNIGAIALAHTKDDLAETVLMRLLRGSGLQGLRGILSIKILYGKKFIRPLLGVDKKDIERYLRKNRISYRKDPTNTKNVYFRNRIRLMLLPLLEKNYNKNIKEILTRLSLHATTDYDFLDKETLRYLPKLIKYSSPKRISLKLNALRKLHPALVRMTCRKIIEQLKGDTKRLTINHGKQWENFLEDVDSPKELDLPRGLKIQKNKETISFSLRST